MALDLSKPTKEVIRQVERIWVAEVVKKIKDKIAQEDLIDSGTLEASIRSEYDDQSVDGEFKFAMADYGKFQDEGVNPKDITLYETPYQFRGAIAGTAEAIKAWSDARGLNNWAVATKLQLITGIRPKQFYKTTIEAMYPKLGDEILKAMTQKLDYDIQNRNK